MTFAPVRAVCTPDKPIPEDLLFEPVDEFQEEQAWA
jgi:hypothetical protein